MKNKILSPKNDLIFKLIFGDLKNVDILESFLKSVLTIPEEEYDHIEIIDPHFKIETINDKHPILDIKLHTTNKQVVDIEIQVLNVKAMKERIIYYNSKLLTEQLSEGMKYKELKKVISILITDFILIKENEIYHNKFKYYDKETNTLLSDITEINTLELPKIPNEADNTNLWNWMKFLKSESEVDLKMIAEKDKSIEKAVGILKQLSDDERTRLLYESREKWIRDEMSRLDDAKEEGFLHGKEEGIKQGVETNKIETAKNALDEGLDIELIMKLTGLTREQIIKIQS